MSSNRYEYDMICIGSGPAGQRAAVQAAKLGRKVAVIERHKRMGGGCLETGTIPSKTFREAVLSTVRAHDHAFQSSGESIGLSMEPLRQRIEEVVQTEAHIVDRQLRRNGIRVLRGNASFAGPHEIDIVADASTRRITGSKILIACGTRPAPVPNVTQSGSVLTSDEILDLGVLPQKLAVVGGGVIGIEYAAIFAALGVEVTLIDRRARPLEFLDREIVDELIHQMRNANVMFCLEETVVAFDVQTSPRPRVTCQLESGKHVVADKVLYAIGRVGATDVLNLGAVGLVADTQGRLKVNEKFQTDVPHIYAAGDIIGYPSLAATSSDQGRLASCFAFGAPAKPMGEHFPVGIYAIPEISMVGAPEHDLVHKKIPCEVGIARYREIARGQILGDDSGLLKMLFHRETRKLLGVHIIGTGATELVHVGQAVIRLGGGIDYFLDTVFNYPTLAECYKVAALDAANKLS